MKLLAFLGCCLWQDGCAPPGRETPAEELRFEHIGPEDASIPPFTVAIGCVTESTSTVIYVTPTTYAAVFASVEQGGASPSRSPRPFGTFQVTVLKGGQSTEIFIIYPETVRSILSRLRHQFQSQNAQMPETLVILETLLTPRP